MPATDLGAKHNCFKCGTKFYDLKKPEPICPKCGSDPREGASVRPATEGRRNRLVSRMEPESEETELTDDVDAIAAEDESSDDYLEEDDA